jgi:ubiquitin-protein ligase
MAATRSMKRIMKDLEEFMKDPIDGVAIYHTEDNIKQIFVVISGPKDSVYQDGLYFFEFNFPDDYPHNPPKGKFLNWQNGIIRIHPNMYVDGKLCLSILGNWTGPSWTSVMSLSTIILSLQSILDDNPLKNEPGYEKNSGSHDHTKYHRIIQYVNYRDFVGKSIESTFNEDLIKENNSYVSYFRHFIVDYYKKNRERILSELERLRELYPNRTSISTVYHATNAVVNYLDLYEDVKKKLDIFNSSV